MVMIYTWQLWKISWKNLNNKSTAGEATEKKSPDRHRNHCGCQVCFKNWFQSQSSFPICLPSLLKSGLPTTTSRLRALEPNWSPHPTPDTGEVSIKATLTIEMTSGQHRAIPQSQPQQAHGSRADQALVARLRVAPGEPASKTGIEEYKATRIEFNNCWDAIKK